MEHVSYRKLIAFKHFLQPPSPSSSSSILPEHAVIENEANEHLVLRPLNGAKILLNGRTMEEGEEEELHHNDRFVWGEGEGGDSDIHYANNGYFSPYPCSLQTGHRYRPSCKHSFTAQTLHVACKTNGCMLKLQYYVCLYLSMCT